MHYYSNLYYILSHWGEAQHKAFEELKMWMCGSPVLIQPNVDKQFTLHVDASAYGMGAILLQEGNHTTKTLAQWHKPVLHPVAYYSATFTPTEWNYNIYERELLAIMKALTHWRHYLGWTKTPFIIHTDHTNLQYWKSSRNLNHWTARWHADLQEYDYIVYPWENQHCGRCSVQTTQERPWRGQQQGCHSHFPTPSLHSKDPWRKNYST